MRTTATTGHDARFDSQSSFGERLLQRATAVIVGIRARSADRRMRYALADLSDAQLLDIGIAEDEIVRVRAFERFTPRSWEDTRGRRRRTTF